MKTERNLLPKLVNQLPQYTPVLCGPGDDCAVIANGDGTYLLHSMDQVIWGVHFAPDTPAEMVAEKLLKRNISDIAAMGGMPQYATLSLSVGLEDSIQEKWLQNFFKGLGKASTEWHVSICGGDLSSLPWNGVVASMNIVGTLPVGCEIYRSGAQVGDFIYVTGMVGNSYKSQHHLTFTPRVAEGQYLGQTKYASAMMDISDGVGIDLWTLCQSSKCGAILNLGQLPLRAGAMIQDALRDGEDYELLFTVHPELVSIFESQWPFQTQFSRIGRIIESNILLDELGHLIDWDNLGWDHFSRRKKDE